MNVLRLSFQNEKYLYLVILLELWAVIYLPYIIYGGLIFDDLGFVDKPVLFSNYFDFQWYIFSFVTMTARPVSALLHGICYWFLGMNAWVYHLVNLSLFLGSVVLVYVATARILSVEVAFLTTLLALLSPTATATAFSSIMMNSNLAAFFWAVAFYLNVSRQNFIAELCVTGLLLLSALAYEAFIPLFIVNLMIVFKVNPTRQQIGWRVVSLILVGGSFAFYRIVVEPFIYGTLFSRIQLPSDIVGRSSQALLLGPQVNFIAPFPIFVRALPNLNLLSLAYLLLLTFSIAISGYTIYRAISDATSLLNYRKLLFIAVLLYIGCHSIYMLSAYQPSAVGYDNRTQGAIRFAAAFLLVTLLKLVYTDSPSFRPIISGGIISLFIIFTIATIGQREAWIAAVHYNDMIMGEITATIEQHPLKQQPRFTLVAQLPDQFPQQVNGEPIFNAFWDISAALSLIYPTKEIKTNVYRPQRTMIHYDGIIIDGYWQATYPFYLFRFSTTDITLVKNETQFRSLIKTVP